MCTYCWIGDQFFRHDPPWNLDPWPTIVPQPVIQPNQINPWPIDKLRDYLEILEKVKKLEDELGCPCEPNKADYIGIFKERIEKLEKKVASRSGKLK